MKNLHSSILLTALLITLTACSGTKEELKPGEAEWISVVEQAEVIVQAGNTDRASCNQVGKLYSDAEIKFKALLPHLKPFDVRSRDMRMGVIKEFRDKDCRR